MPDPRAEIRAFLVENFLFGDGEFPLADGDSLVGKGVVDSSGVLELVAFLETRFGFTLTDTEIVPANLDSVARIARLVASKTSEERRREG